MSGPLPRYNVPGLERGLRLLQLFDRARKLLTAALAVPFTVEACQTCSSRISVPNHEST